ncbi:MAG: hypothetical protein RDU25_01780 [Patescibacteria group bacterium]|nr:hypothetical protein [Patescibacteria group bacterium]
MSLQRIIESARKLGVPIIMTDPAGREPLVIVSLEQFEAMAGSPQDTMPSRSNSSKLESDTRFSESEIVTKTIEQEDLPQDIYMEDVPPPPNAKVLTDEERFYLEPLDDQNS